MANNKGYKTTKKNVEKAFSQQMVESIEKAISLSRDAWKNPCLFQQGLEQGPYNYFSGKSYDGVNVFMLSVTQLINGWTEGAWLTFNQVSKIAEKTGKSIHVRKGEKSSEVIFWKKYAKYFTVGDTEDSEEEDTDTTEDTKEENTEKKVLKTMWVLKSYRVFNVEQIEWDGYDYSAKLKKQSAKKFDEVALATMESAQNFLSRLTAMYR